MGARVSRTDYEWVHTQEPHKTRRKEILAKYPEIKSLMGHDIKHAFVVPLMLLVQILSAYTLRDASWPTILLVAYVWGGVINHSMALAIHEIAHNLAFGHSRPFANRFLAMIANLCLGFPYYALFKKYHLEHHKYQGDDLLDVDIPSRLEARLFYNTLTKLIWVILQPLIYSLRPLLMNPKPIGMLDVVNFALQAVFNIIIVYTMGWKSLSYLCAGTFLVALHPVGGHFLSEHFMNRKGYETNSYYGPLNAILFNAGYHTEHHDFPNIPGSRLPQVRRIASEYYDNLPSHTSWVKVIYDFITDPDMGLYSRVKRETTPFPGKIPTKED